MKTTTNPARPSRNHLGPWTFLVGYWIFPFFFVSLVLLVINPGCGPSGPKKYQVSGTVTWQGQPLPEGDIVFIPLDPNIAPDAGKIVNGQYQFAAQAGKKKVEIDASREVPGKFDPLMQQAVRESYIPERYNVKSILTAEVTPESPNRFDYPLEAK